MNKTRNALILILAILTVLALSAERLIYLYFKGAYNLSTPIVEMEKR